MKARPFIVENWTRRVDDLPHRRITFTPNYKTFFSKLMFTFVLFLCAAGFVGLDYELWRMRENHRITPEEMEQHKRGYDHQLAVERRARGEAAEEKLRKELYGFLEKRAAEKAAKIEQMEKDQALWHWLVRGSIGLLAGWGVFIPLSLLWRRCWIGRDGDDLVFRYRNMLGGLREEKVSAAAAVQPQIRVQEIRFRARFGTVSDGFRWELAFFDGQRTVLLHPRRSKTLSPGVIDPEVEALVREMRNL